MGIPICLRQGEIFRILSSRINEEKKTRRPKKSKKKNKT
jgi:hypothetical protein